MTTVLSFKDILTPETFESMRKLIRRTFPDRKAPAPSDGMVDAVIGALPAEARAALGLAGETVNVMVAGLKHLSQTQGIARGVMQEDASETATYYRALATHTRTGPGAHEFTASIPMVRVELPAVDATDLDTHFGTVYAGDHKVHTVELLRAKYHEFFSFSIGRVFLTTPARLWGARFAAIATYEVFDTKGTLQAWVLEAGLATGEAMVLYASPHGQPIDRKAWYQPTPFADQENWYRGAATFDDAGPLTLKVQVSTPEEREHPAARAKGGHRPPREKRGHMTVSVAYEVVTGEEARGGTTPEDALKIFPSRLTAEAGLRVAAIAVARGDKDPLFLLLAPFGHALDWEKRP